MNTFKNTYGSVKPYTRHTSACPHRHKKDHNACSCPKWLYVNRRGEQPYRRTLNTPSWAETQGIAADTLKGFDPEIAAARAAKKKTEQQLLSIPDACALWMQRSRLKLGDEAGGIPQYRSLMKKFETWAAAHDIRTVQEITTLALEKWYASSDWTRHAESTRSQRWGVLRSFFSYLKERKIIDTNPIAAIDRISTSDDHVQGPYTDEQVVAIFEAARRMTVDRVSTEKQEKFAERLSSLLELLLHTGCDLIDAVLFEPSRIEDVAVDGQIVPVYRYKRKKTGVAAIIPLSAEVAERLRSVPTIKGDPASLPFRSAGIDLLSDVHNWSRRIARALKAANVTYVELPSRDERGQPRTKDANSKMFRHTFAVRKLREGQRPEEVARMLGHVDTTMVRRHYAPWVPELDDAHIRMVLKAQRGASVSPRR